MMVTGWTPVPLCGGMEFANGRGNVARPVTPRLEKDVYDELREAAAVERRPLPNFIATAALARIREAQFVDGGEMAEILGNDALVRRLKAGSQQARQRTGDFVASVPDLRDRAIPQGPTVDHPGWSRRDRRQAAAIRLTAAV